MSLKKIEGQYLFFIFHMQMKVGHRLDKKWYHQEICDISYHRLLLVEKVVTYTATGLAKYGQ